MSDGSVTVDTKIDDSGIKKGLDSISDKTKTALKGVTVVAGAVAVALAGFGTAAIKSYSDFQQNVGGVETLFKNSSDTVIKNAENAYKTARIKCK